MLEMLNELQGIQKKHIIVDCDEVLVRISPKWVYLMHQPENFEYFNKYLDLLKDFDLQKNYIHVLNRDTFYLNEWLLRKDKKFSIEELDEVKERMMDVYNSGDFYTTLKPTPMAKSLSFTAKSPLLNKISVVTRSTEKSINDKDKFIKHIFQGSMDKVDIYHAEPNEKKSDIINNLGNDIAAIYDDEISNVNDIINNCHNVKDLIFGIPSYGYNSDIPDNTYEVAKNKGVIIKYYN